MRSASGSANGYYREIRVVPPASGWWLLVLLFGIEGALPGLDIARVWLWRVTAFFIPALVVLRMAVRVGLR